MECTEFEPWLTRWRLSPDGEGFASLAGKLLPVRHQDGPAILKLSWSQEEIAGGTLMEWWNGDGAARVIAREGEALLLERATGPRLLTTMARGDEDDEATRILCTVGARLHATRSSPPPTSLVPLEYWFRQLWPTAATHGGLYAKSAKASRSLLNQPQEVGIVHGDLHHANVLDFGARGWLAIDPKGLLGERGYDFPHIIMNPDIETASAPGRLGRRVAVISEAAAIDPRRLLTWIVAYAGLSASWTLADGDDPWRALTIGEIAAAELGV